MGGEKKAYGTYGDGVIEKGEIIWNVNKEYRKKGVWGEQTLRKFKNH